MLKFTRDMTYCNTIDCIHRFGCKRYPENYDNFPYDKFLSWVDDQQCKETNYDLLKKFRNSNERWEKMSGKIEVGQKWLRNDGQMGEIIEINGIKRMAIKFNGKILKTLTIQKLKPDEWTLL